MKKLNVAIIGQGRSGRDIHGAFFKSEQNTLYKVVAVADELECRREKAAQEYGCDVYADYRELFKRSDLDLVVNSTYSYLHYPVTMDLLEHGCNVVVEKPFARHAADCDAMIAKAAEKGVMLDVFQQSRFAPYFLKIKEILASGVLGEIMQISIAFSGFARRWDWQCSQRFCGGSLLNTGPHPMDQALDLLGPDVQPQVFSKLACVNTFGDAEDYVKVILTAPGKPLIDVEISSCNAYAPYTYVIQAKNGSLRATTQKIEYQYFVPEEEQPRQLILTPLFNDQGNPAYCRETLHWIKKEEEVSGSAFDSAVCKYYQMIYDHLTAGAPLEITPAQIRRQIAVAEQIHNDNPLPVKY